MWRATVIFNTLIAWLCSAASVVPYAVLQNHFVEYDSAHGKPLPGLSVFVIGNGWILGAWALAAAVVACVILFRFHRRRLPEHLLALHLSAVVLGSFTILVVFMAGGIFPFIPIVTGMKGS